MKSNWDTLLVDDNEDDAFLVKRAFTRVGVPSRITHCRDGRSALGYFEGEAEYSDREHFPLPHLLLLDLKIPFHDGLEVLGWLRGHEVFHSQIVIILTSSAEHHDIREAHRLHVNAYLVKPAALDEMIQLVRCIQTCWLNERLDALLDHDSGRRPPAE